MTIFGRIGVFKLRCLDKNRIFLTNFEKKAKYLTAAIIIGIVFFFFGGPDYYSSRSIKYIWNFGHIIFYCILSYILLSNWNKLKLTTYYYQIAWIVVITFFLGLIVEFIQAGINRAPDFGDLARNFIGSFIVLFFFAPKKNEISFRKLFLSRCILILIIIFQIIPFINFLRDERDAIVQFPLLSGFESKLELSRWVGDAKYIINKDIKSTGSSSLKIQLNTSKYSGIYLKYFPKNWDSYNVLSFKIYNSQNDSFRIKCRIHDKIYTEGEQLYTDRFNGTYTLLKGWNVIEVNLNDIRNAPLKRKMNMNNIYGLGIFVTSQKENKIIYLDDVFLRK